MNNTVAHFSPLESDPSSSQTLAKGDVVKIHLGAHIDGFAAVSAETVVVGASAAEPITGRKADVIQAAWHAAEVAMRLVKVGNKNWQVTDAVGKVAAAFDCKPVEGASYLSFLLRVLVGLIGRNIGMLSCQQAQNVIDGKKRIILNPVCLYTLLWRPAEADGSTERGTKERVRDRNVCGERGLGRRHPHFLRRRRQGTPHVFLYTHDAC